MKQFMTSLLLFSLGSASGKNPSFLTIKATPAYESTKKLLQLRGGALDPKFFTDTMTVVTIGQGFLAMEAPEPCLELYGTNDKSLGTQFCSRIMGASILSIGVTALCLFTMNLDAKKAIGWSLIVWIVEHARALVNQVPSKIGYDPAGQSLWLVLNILCVYACFTEAAYTDSLLFTLFGIWAVNCVVAVVAPRTAASVYVQDHDSSFLNFEQVCWTQGYGHAGLAHCVFALSLLKGVDPHRAMGLMSVSVLVQCAHILLGPYHAGTVGNFMTAVLLVFHAANFVTLALK